ncbi:hypothetical protein [Thiofilum flexile]|uniref:hypothetical protein n=1 Tax=Thiofilum flexile TaxID=125627 RepID=UPI00037C4CB0|nr:hypothetical protein [Thiofilum flexile]
MITVCYPRDEVEQILLVAELGAADIPYFINSQYLGGILPGMQIPGYNERSISVPPSYYEEAIEVINKFREHYVPQSEGLRSTSKFRILLEAVLFGWAIPYGKKKNKK